ncbi:MAG: cpaA [Phenylobacterium sp.]|jgi:prepilin peptidase CpaA|nr:cpaA [Phenylobacterium sp.]
MALIEHAPVAFGLSVTAAALAWAAASDFSRYLIPNRVCLLAVAGYAIAGLGLPLGPWLAGWATGAAALTLGAALFARGWVGGGDVKLCAAAVLWAGLAHLSDFALVTALTGAGLAGLMLSPLRRWMPRPAWADGAAGSGLGQPMPFGVPIAAGGTWVLALHLTSAF